MTLGVNVVIYLFSKHLSKLFAGATIFCIITLDFTTVFGQTLSIVHIYIYARGIEYKLVSWKW